MKKHVYYLALIILIGSNSFAYLEDGDTSEEEAAPRGSIFSKMTFERLKKSCADIVSVTVASYLDATEMRKTYWRNVLLDIRINPEKYEKPENIVQAIQREVIPR